MVDTSSEEADDSTSHCDTKLYLVAGAFPVLRRLVLEEGGCNQGCSLDCNDLVKAVDCISVEADDTLVEVDSVAAVELVEYDAVVVELVFELADYSAAVAADCFLFVAVPDVVVVLDAEAVDCRRDRLGRPELRQQRNSM